MKKFKKFFKRFKKILSKIVNDKQLLTIFTLMIVVIVVGCIAIGVLRTFIIIASLVGIAFFAKFIIDTLSLFCNHKISIFHKRSQFLFFIKQYWIQIYLYLSKWHKKLSVSPLKA